MTALVLSGGGLGGIAWETGVLLGLRDEGVDVVGDCGVVVGTSAGATVGAQVLSGTDLADLYAAQLHRDHTELAPMLNHDALAAIFAEFTGDLSDPSVRRRIGTLALGADTIPEAVRRDAIARRLPSKDWPARSLLLTTVDAHTGELVVLDAESGVELVDAVAASCAVPGVWPPVTIRGRRYIDGGVRSPAHATVAAGCETVVILAPLAGPPADMVQFEAADLRAAGTHVVVIQADDATLAAMGPNPLDPASRPASAEHGRRQGRSEAASLRPR